MIKYHLSVREIETKDIPLIVQYWQNAESSYLKSLGVDLNKLPAKEQLTQWLLEQINLPREEKKSYCIIWEVDGVPMGHSNTNPSLFGKEAYLHLHFWESKARRRGLGTKLVKMSLPYFFENMQLKKLYCEPYALNPGPNKTLEKAGFDFVKEYVTTPGSMNFEQPVKRWELSYENFKKMQ